MNSEMLKMLVKMACSDGNLSPEELNQLNIKAKEFNIDEDSLNQMIENEFESLKNKNNTNSGFTLNENTKEQTNTSSETKHDLESGFVVSENTKSGFTTTNDNESKEAISGFETTKNTEGTEQKQTEEFFSNISLLSQQGAMSLIYTAKRHGKRVIVKRLKPEHRNDAKYKTLFYQEFENAYKLNHHNIVSFYDKGMDNDGPFYYMEYIDGRPLTEIITKHGITDGKFIKNIAIQILDGLSYVHKQQIYHRDLKPDNILITYKGDNVKLIDFGLALSDAFDDDLAKVGTPKYAAPEQKNKGNQADQRADIYSFGMILLEMLTGSTDYLHHAAKRADKITEIIGKCIEVSQKKRFQNVNEIIEEINQCEIKDLAPELWISQKIINFGRLNKWTATGSKIIKIANSGFGSLQWKAQTNSNEIDISLENNNLKIQIKSFKKKKIDAIVEIISNGGNIEIPITADIYNPTKKILIYTLSTLICIALCFSVIHIVKKNSKTETQSWQETIANNSIESYAEFITKFPKGKHLNEAKTRLEKMQKEEILWQRALKKQTPETFNDYIMAYPTGKYAEQADAKKDELIKERNQKKEEMLWQSALKINSIDFYTDYIQKYPNGKYVIQATTAIEKLSDNEKTKKPTDPKNNPTEVIREFIELIGNKQYYAAYEKTQNRQWSSFEKFSSKKYFGAINKTKIISTILLNQEGHKAEVIAEYYAFDFENNTEKEYSTKYILEAVNGEWKITNTEVINIKTIE